MESLASIGFVQKAVAYLPTSDKFECRFCREWRLIPAIALVALLVIDVSLAVIGGYTTFHIITQSVELACGLLMLYLAHQYRYRESQEQILKKLNGENVTYAKQNKKYEKLIDKLAIYVEDIKSQLSEETGKLHDENEKLAKTGSLYEVLTTKLDGIQQLASEVVHDHKELYEQQKKEKDSLLSVLQEVSVSAKGQTVDQQRLIEQLEGHINALEQSGAKEALEQTKAILEGLSLESCIKELRLTKEERAFITGQIKELESVREEIRAENKQFKVENEEYRKLLDVLREQINLIHTNDRPTNDKNA